jgi:FMN phosphatase YigB (HAD superfamily)
MVIRAIFYDLDGTLRMNVPNSWRAFTDFAIEFGLIINQEDCLRVARWEHRYYAESPELLADRVSFPDRSSFWFNFCFRQLVVLGASSQQVADLASKLHQRMTDVYRPADIIPDGLLETLTTLKQQGYLLGVMSNRNESFSDYLSELGLAEFFSLAVFAGEAGIYKPNPGVFQFLLEKAGVSAEESIYIGDNYYADIVGARAAGLSPILFDVNGLFDEPDFPVIQSHPQILQLLDRMHCGRVKNANGHPREDARLSKLTNPLELESRD